jgi:hypothetical protein
MDSEYFSNLIGGQQLIIILHSRKSCFIVISAIITVRPRKRQCNVKVS